MTMTRIATTLSALALLSACNSYQPSIQTGKDQTYSQEIEVVEDMRVLEVPMSEYEPGLPYTERYRIENFLAEYKARGKNHGPLVVSLPLNSPWGQQLNASVKEAYRMADEFGVRDVKRSDYESNGAPEAPMVLAFSAYRAIAPDCPRVNELNLAYIGENDTLPSFGCAMQTNLAAMIADPADLIGARQSDPADLVRRAVVLQKYRAGQSTATERTEAETGAISDAVE